MPRQVRTRPIVAAQTRAYVVKAEEYLEAAVESLGAGRNMAATSLAVHAAINAADAVTGVRLGCRAAGEDHSHALGLLGQAGPDGAAVARDLARLLPLKTRAEYDPEDVPSAVAARAVEQARRCVLVARRAVQQQ